MLEARNAGKPIGDARGEMGMVVDTFRFYAGAVERMLGDTIPVAGGVAMTFREPLGVVALITPWNFPLDDRLVEARAVPGGRQHRRAQAGRAHAAHRARVRAARAGGRAARGRRQRRRRARARPAARGSSSTPTSPRSRSPAPPRSAARSPRARRRRSSASRSSWAASRPTSCSPTPTCEAAAAAAPWAVFGNAGQDCCARSRILVQESALDEFLAALKAVVEGIRVGDPLDEATQMGPLISAAQRETVGSYVARGRARGGPRQRARRPRLLVPADRALRRSTPATARCARRSSARSRA